MDINENISAPASNLETLPVKGQDGVWSEVRDYLMIALGTLLYTGGVSLFMLPYELTTGGISGVASIIYYAANIPVSMSYGLINACFLVAAVKVLGWKFCLKTIAGVSFSTLWLALWQYFLTAGGTEDWPHICGNELFMACILGPLICGIGLSICFENNGSTGGTDIIAAIVNKYRDISLGRVGMYLDIIIISSSYFAVPQTENVFYGYVVLVTTSLMIDFVVNRSNQSVQFFIISQKYEEIGRRINAMPNHRGCTMIDGTGFYSGQPVKMLFVLTRKHEAALVFRLIKDTGPMAFVSQANVNGVYGNGFDIIKVS